MKLIRISYLISLVCRRWSGKIIRVNNKTSMQCGAKVLDTRKLNYDETDNLSAKPSWKSFEAYVFAIRDVFRLHRVFKLYTKTSQIFNTIGAKENAIQVTFFIH